MELCINYLVTYFAVMQTPVGEKYDVGGGGRGGILQHAWDDWMMIGMDGEAVCSDGKM